MPKPKILSAYGHLINLRDRSDQLIDLISYVLLGVLKISFKASKSTLLLSMIVEVTVVYSNYTF